MQAQPGTDVYAAFGIFARRIADQLDYSAIVFPSLVTRAARLQGQSAAWDGVRRRVDGPTSSRNRRLDPRLRSVGFGQGVRGEIAAASLHVAVLSPDGELRFEGAGGLSLLQELEPGGARHINVQVGDARKCVRRSRRVARGNRGGIPQTAAGLARALTSRSRHGAHASERRGLHGAVC